MIYAYLRVSTDHQDADNQKHGINNYVRVRNLQPLTFVEDTVSGTQHWTKRELGKIVRQCGADDVIIFSEVSRIARGTLQTLEFLKIASEKKISIHIAKQQMVFDNSINSKIIATTLALAAEIEREFISARTKEALAKLKAEGKKLGRPQGSTSVNKTLQENHNQLVDYLKKGLTKSAIAKIYDVHRNTVSSYVRQHVKRADVEH